MRGQPLTYETALAVAGLTSFVGFLVYVFYQMTRINK